MSVGKAPEERKHALVTLHTKAARCLALLTVSQFFLRINNSGTRNHQRDFVFFLRKQGLITKHQHGFLSCRFTTSNRVAILNDWTLTINNNNSIAVE